MNALKDFIKVLNDGGDSAYDFIANNYYNMTKSELADIIKELIWAIHDMTYKLDGEEIFKAVGEELEESYMDEDEE